MTKIKTALEENDNVGVALCVALPAAAGVVVGDML